MATMKPIFKALLQGIGWLLLVIAGLAFWVGGRALHEFVGVERALAEMEGIGLAAVCGVLGYAAKSAAENLLDPEENKESGDESKQK